MHQTITNGGVLEIDGKANDEEHSVINILVAGPPQLMMAFTGDGQIDPKLIEARDKREGKTTADLAEHRQKLHYPDNTNPEADSWLQKGVAWQTEMKQTSLKK